MPKPSKKHCLGTAVQQVNKFQMLRLPISRGGIHRGRDPRRGKCNEVRTGPGWTYCRRITVRVDQQHGNARFRSPAG